jgi:hypothetical protein
MGTLIGKMIWIVANGTFSFTVSGLVIRAGRLRALSTGVLSPCVRFLFVKFSVGLSLVGGTTFVLSGCGEISGFLKNRHFLVN